jgi:sodium pump decarboxylase gamma subunit
MKRAKKIILCLMSIMLVGLCGAKNVSAAYQVITEDMASNCADISSQSVEALASYDEATLSAMAENRDDFTRQAVGEWLEQVKELGTYKSSDKASSVIDLEAETVTVSVPAVFEKNGVESRAVVTFLFNYYKDLSTEQMVPAYMTLAKEETFAGNMGGAGINTLMGVGTVFVVLIFLIFVISLFKYINKIGAKKETKAAPAVQPAPVAAVPVPAVEENLTDDLELVAVISAAIAASENTSTDSFVVRSIKKVNRNKWQRA